MAPTTYADVLARNIRAARSRAGLSQQAVAERMRELGFGEWMHQTVGKVERVKRRVTGEEMLGLALCLGTTVQRLMTPLWEDKWVDLPSGAALRVGAVVTLVTGQLAAMDSIPTDQEFLWHRNKLVRAIVAPQEMEGVRWAPSDEPGQQPKVITAIVTSDRGVLVGRRNDRTPPWTFIAGENEPGEDPVDTIIREAKEEACLEIEVGAKLGERVHPDTGRLMVYYAAKPTHGTDVRVGDEAELSTVDWVNLAKADELLPGMFGPVREHLMREIGGS